MYPLLFRTVLSRMDPEDAHHLASTAIALLPSSGFGWIARRLTAPDPSLAVDALGLRFLSPFGVAAGFDKDAQAVLGLGQLGFGHVEVGTVTAEASRATRGRACSACSRTAPSSTAWASTTGERPLSPTGSVGCGPGAIGP